MLAATNADEKQSVKKMEANDELRTIECLRGRLLAERASSKLANENANLLGNKLIELENKLRKEIKSKNKAKKKLKFLMKKLESMKINYVSESSYSCTSTSSSTSSASITKHPKEEDQILKSTKINYVSESSYSCTSSSSSTSSASVIKHPKEEEEEEEDQVPKSQFSDSEKCSSSITEINQNSSENTLSGSNCDYDDASVENSRQPKSIQSCKDSQNDDDDDDQSIKSSMRGGMEINEENSNNGEEDNDDCIEKSLALVLVPLNIETEAPPPPPPPPSLSQKCENMKIVKYKSVGEVLDALRHAREMLQSSMDNKRHI